MADAVVPPRGDRLASARAEFEAFFRGSYRELLRTVMYAGATKAEAEDAVAVGMTAILKRGWEDVDSPFAYARQAAINSLIKERERSLERLRRRLVERAAGNPTAAEDAGLTVWEDRQWVMQILHSLPPAQREVLALIVDGLRSREIAQLLGKTEPAVRRNLCDARRRAVRVLRARSFGPATSKGNGHSKEKA